MCLNRVMIHWDTKAIVTRMLAKRISLLIFIATMKIKKLPDRWSRSQMLIKNKWGQIHKY